MINFYTQKDYDKYLDGLFGPFMDTDDPLMHCLRAAVEKDIDPRHAVYYWLKRGGKNSTWFKLGIRSQKNLLSLLESRSDYFDKYGKDFLKYLCELSKKL